MNLFELTRELIDIPSLTGAEADVSHFLASHLTRLGYSVALQDGVADSRANLIATTTDQPRVFLSTHMDTVPPHIKASEDDDSPVRSWLV